MLINKLSAPAVKAAKERDKTYRLFDGGGLYLEIRLSGYKYWYLKYRIGGKERRLFIGTYPEISLAKARDSRNEAKKQVKQGIDPVVHKQQRKRTTKNNQSNSFEIIAREWFAKFSINWKESHSKRILRRLEADVFPWLGHRPAIEINPPELLAVLRRVENRGAVDTAHRIKQTCGMIFRYAIATGRAERDPSQDLKGALPPPKKSSFAAITKPKEIGGLLRAINGYEGQFVTLCALKLAPLLFVRPGELRHAEWSEIDYAACEWRIPADKMKMDAIHIIPLARQAITILQEIEPLTGRGKYIFPSVRSNSRPMSENTVTAALRRLGYSKDEMTGHGFRAMASTLLNEQGWKPDAIERQLAHSERDSVRAAYNYAEYLPERATMMQSWADFLDGLRDNVVPISTARLGQGSGKV